MSDHLMNDLRVAADRGDYDTKLPYSKGRSKADKQAAREAHNDDDARLVSEFKVRLREAMGIEEGEYAARVIAYIWELGHSGGYSEIISYACDFPLPGDE